jgi:hypothetical protein
MRTGIYPEVKRPVLAVHHAPPFSADIKNGWSFTSTHVHALKAWTAIAIIFNIFIVTYYTYNLIYQKKESNANIGQEKKRN